jgi:hypothetical protein
MVFWATSAAWASSVWVSPAPRLSLFSFSPVVATEDKTRNGPATVRVYFPDDRNPEKKNGGTMHDGQTRPGSELQTLEVRF